MLTILEYLLLAALIALDLIISRWIGQQSYSWMPPEATAEARRVDELFSFLVTAGAFIYIGVISVILYSILFFRAKEDDYSEGHPGRGNWKIEVLWTVIPIILVMWLAIQSYSIYGELDISGLSKLVQLVNPLEKAAYAKSFDHQSNSRQEVSNQKVDEDIQVFVKQWQWYFRYKNGLETHELHLPLNETVRLVMNSLDVIHGFYVPEFRLKQDIFPNRTITFVFSPTRAGKYRLQDSQFSGTYFSLMQANVYVESPQEYNQWLNKAANAQIKTQENERIASEQEWGAEPVPHQSLKAENLRPEPSKKPLFNSGWQS
ncbi:cytochrome c oxidase subunit II [Gloeothece verrucosa]|uniref:Cytochrome c oxidase subunit 2 n=1 Tax=Gloeothece verrucosa (strain PCC 7822) TaxID=497965 RepID=E0UL91_GLOV7|nr:cytochrome c oxidase subunit II [Gloeothece verrucosa]ADN17721.1 cytochrome c oxidase subunit II [Gloeothece verrucosa PCC 7822]